MVTIHLGQDESQNNQTDCLGCWVSAKEAGLIPEDSDQDQKGNFKFQFKCFYFI